MKLVTPEYVAKMQPQRSLNDAPHGSDLIGSSYTYVYKYKWVLPVRVTALHYFLSCPYLILIIGF